jgi:hypothetical protein
MNVVFGSQHFSGPADAPLKDKLSVFFNRPDVYEKMMRVSGHIFEGGRKRDGYALSTYGLQIFSGNPETDGDPYNLCAAVLHATHDMRKDAEAPQVVKAGLEQVARELCTLAEVTPGNGELKTGILHAAKTSGINEGKGKV